MPRRFMSKPWLSLLLLTIMAGVIYNSWPLGYWLNPVVNRGLASDLEATGQPYNWVFIAGDIISGLLICIATVWLLSKLRQTRSTWMKIGLIGFGVFGALTAVDALLPLDCVSVVQRCGPVLENPIVILHGVASMGSIAGLTLSIVSVWWLLARDERTAASVRYLLHGTLLVWCGFGIATLILIFLSRSSALSQHIFITLCSVWTALLPYLIWKTLLQRGILRKKVSSGQVIR